MGTAVSRVGTATDLTDLRIPPGNHLEELKDDRKGQHSIRINDQFRICFVWKNADAFSVEIVDYQNGGLILTFYRLAVRIAKSKACPRCSSMGNQVK
jgi:hypothetical protein